MVENSNFIKCLRNVHLEKSAVTGLFHPSCSPTTAKTPAKVHLRLRFQNRGKPRTAGLCGRAAGACDCGPLSVLKSNGLRLSKNLPAKFGFSPKSTSTNIAKKLPLQRCFKPLLIALFNFLHKRPTFAFTSESGYTLAFRRRIAHNGSHGETGGISGGGGITTLGPFRTFTNIPGPGIRTANFAAFWSWPGVLPKNAESLRDSDALMRVAVPRRRGPAGLRDLFRFCRNRSLYALRSGPFRVCEARGGITTLSALYVLLKRRTAACQNGSFAVF